MQTKRFGRPTRFAVPALLLVAVLASACTSSSNPGTIATTAGTASPVHGIVGSGVATGAGAAGSTSASTTTSTTSPAPKPHKTVRVTSLESDGATYGVGMPIVLFFTPAPTDATAFTSAVKVTVNGSPVNGAWYWEQPTADEKKAGTVEAHYRMSGYWPAHSKIHVATPIGGLSAGKNLVYSGKLTSLDLNIGAEHVSTVDATTLRMRVESDGKVVKTVPVSLGAAATPTFNGVKVVMQKGEDIPGTDKVRADGTVLMNGPNYTNDPVQWSVRITRSGEYVHSAPWNGQIGARSTSNGCTNLHAADGKWFYQFAQVGDVVIYSHTDGKRMPSWDGFGDWNLSWSTWQQGGLL